MSTLKRLFSVVVLGLTVCLGSNVYSEPFGYSYFRQQGQTNIQTLAMSQSIHPDYKLGPGDELLIKTRGIQNQDIRASVTIQGTISIPQVAPVNVMGKTILDAQVIVKENILTVLKNVDVEVDISSLREFNVFVTGEANAPGTYTVTGNHSILDLLYLCGGPTQKGSFRRIIINRIVNATDKQEGTRSREEIVVDLYDFFIQSDHRMDLFLEAGDVLWIPPVGPFVDIGGEVKRPATYELTNETILSQIVDLAGGTTESAYLTKIVIQRKIQGSLFQQINIDYSTPIGKNFSIQNGDQIFVLNSNQLVILLDRASSLDNIMAVTDIVLDREIYQNLNRDFLPTVTIIGEISNPGIYNFAPEERFDSLLIKAGGLLQTAYQTRAELVRTTGEGNVTHKLIPIKSALSDKQSEDNFELQDKDIINIQAISAIDAIWKVKITGEVEQPGDYNIVTGSRLSDLIVKAGGLKQSAYLAHAELIRVSNEGAVTHKLIPLKSALSDKQSEDNFELQDKDIINIQAISAIDAIWKAQITGEVLNPGTFSIVNGSRISDLLMKAGGLRELAYTPRAELTRYREGKVAEILQIDLSSIIKDESSKNNILLNNFDHLHIHSKPIELTSIVVQVNGQVEIPGAYTLPKDSTLSAALKSAGGIRPEGSLSSLVLVRQSLLEEEKSILVEIEENQEQELLRLQSSIIDSAVTDDEKQLQLRSLEIRKRIITLLGKRRILGRLIFDPQNEDPVLKEGDSITVPAVPESVLVIGAVYGSGSITYKKDYTIDQYLNLLGGLTHYADEQQIYIMKPNGFVERKSDNMSPVMPGDIIVVPPKVEDRLAIQSTK